MINYTGRNHVQLVFRRKTNIILIIMFLCSSLSSFTPICSAAPPSSGCLRHDPVFSHFICTPHHLHLPLATCPPSTELSNPRQPDASAFVIAALCLHGEPACEVGVSPNAGDCYALEGALLVGVIPANPHKEMTPQHMVQIQYTVEFMWHFFLYESRL